MTWIERHLAALRVLCASAGICISVIVLWFFFVNGQRSVPISRLQLGLLVLPWVVAFGTFLPLTYHSWFKNAPGTRIGRVLHPALRVFFWVFALCVAFVFFEIYRTFVFTR